MSRGLLGVLWITLACAMSGFAQSSTETPAAPATTTPIPAAPAPAAPEEYEEGEFTPGLKALRRGEIILLGSFPFSLFFSYEAYDIYRFFANDRQIQYAPWPFRRPDAVPYESYETTGVLVAAVSVSLVLAVADYMIGKAIERRAAKRRSPDR